MVKIHDKSVISDFILQNNCKYASDYRLKPPRCCRRAADTPVQPPRLCRMTEGCTPTEARLSTGRPGLLLPFPACRVVGTEQWAAQNAVLFFATLFNPRAAPWRPVASSLPQATEFNPGTALPQRWWKTAGQLHDYKVWLFSADLTVGCSDDKQNQNISEHFICFVFNLKKKITCKCYTESYWNILISCLSAQVTNRHTGMQTFCSFSHCCDWKKGKQGEAGEKMSP